MRGLSRKGIVESKTVSGQRRRGGRVSRSRVAYEKGFVRGYVDRYLAK
ncbi:MAG: hypothetical protein JRN06_01445 [Nitrososphaerota archaeon]|nr:hypothetical protein [Nitrososphaerota archaeon]MDG7023483.1 hypothetical protein [Nitrososphaerota archaeon]